MDFTVVFPITIFFVSFSGGETKTNVVDLEPCPVSSPCSCDAGRILCDDANLTQIPKFKKINVTFMGWRLYLSNNNISYIPPKAFINITLILLSMSNTSLRHIADDAFYGSEHSVFSLYLQSNNLIQLPNAFGKLKNLTYLSVNGNPLTTFPREIMKNLSHSLQLLDLGSPEMQALPKEIAELKALRIATFYMLPMEDLPNDAFQGMEDLPLTLVFLSSNFVRIPKALRSLTSMIELDISNSARISSTGIDETSFKGMKSLKTLSITKCNLTTVPNISELSSLRTLELSECPISRWDERTLPGHSTITGIILDKTLFQRIPMTISQIKNLTELSLFGTNITEVTVSDLAGLNNLTGLTLSYSPVRDIALNAFSDNTKLKYLNLDNLDIGGFPRAIRNLTALKEVDLTNNKINCSCADMGWMKGWVGIGRTWVNGDCQNRKEKINDFLLNDIEKC